MENTKVFAEMTKAEKFGEISKVEGVPEEMKEFLNKEIETLKKKNTYKSKADKEKDVENKNIEDIIVKSLTGLDKPISTTDIALMVGTKLEKYISTQRIVPRCKSLVASGIIACVTEKGVNKYKAV